MTTSAKMIPAFEDICLPSVAKANAMQARYQLLNPVTNGVRNTQNGGDNCDDVDNRTGCPRKFISEKRNQS